MMSAIQLAFEHHRDELDQFNDRRERLIKVSLLLSCRSFLLLISREASRDITNLSKKTIFLLHRLALESSPSSSTSKVAEQGYSKLREVKALYASLSHELEKDLFWRHERQVSPGLQEFIEALGFAYYLECGKLVSFKDVQYWLSDTNGVPVGARSLCRPTLYS